MGISYGIKIIVSTIVGIVNIAIVFFQKMKRPLKQIKYDKRARKVSNISIDGRNIRKTQRQIYRCLEILYIYVKDQYINKIRGKKTSYNLIPAFLTSDAFKAHTTNLNY